VALRNQGFWDETPVGDTLETTGLHGEFWTARPLPHVPASGPAGRILRWLEFMSTVSQEIDLAPTTEQSRILRMYSPLKPWIDQTWRPGEVELVK
jgi:hypothetical protein